MKPIGIVACSAEGAALCYRNIINASEAQLGRYQHPQISLHNHSLAHYVDCLEQENLAGIAELMLDSAQRLQRAGAELLICPDNTIHRAFHEVCAKSTVPWLSIAEVVVAHAQSAGFRCLGILGTRWLVDSAVYPEVIHAAGLNFIRPPPAARDEINRIIMEELIYHRTETQALHYCQAQVAALKSVGCDAVVLGCTELPLLLNDDNVCLPTLNSNALLAQAAVAAALID